jgi:DNA polymerase-3 subunit epsilon
MRFIAFDLETTGTLAGVDKIVEIGAVRFNASGDPETIFTTLIQPTISMPPDATRVNGITDDMLVGKPRVEDVLDAFADFCGDDIVVAHNAAFDAQFLTADIRKFESKAPRGVILDTLPLARKVYPGLANYKLGTLVQHLGIPSSNFHRAEEDAIYCGHLFAKMLQRLTQPQTPSLATLISLTGKPEQRFPQIERKPKQQDLFSMSL